MNVLTRETFHRSPRIIGHAGRVVLGASGVISSTDCEGFTVTKTAAKTGRYTIQLVDSLGKPITALKFRGGYASILGPDDAAAAAGKGTKFRWRADTIATNGQIFLQWQRNNGITDDNDAEVEDNLSFDIVFWVKDSSVK